jgi:hypothetical protein
MRKPQYDRNGYAVYMLSVGNVQVLRSAHRLVADAFLGPIPKDRHVNHKNGLKADPRLVNLELVTIGENRAHSYRALGIKPNVKTGFDNPNASLTSEQVEEIRARYAAGAESYRLLAEAFGTTKQTIARIVKRRTRNEG